MSKIFFLFKSNLICFFFVLFMHPSILSTQNISCLSIFLGHKKKVAGILFFLRIGTATLKLFLKPSSNVTPIEFFLKGILFFIFLVISSKDRNSHFLFLGQDPSHKMFVNVGATRCSCLYVGF